MTTRQASSLRDVDANSRGLWAAVHPYLEILRPTQWVKNVVVFAGPAAGLKLVEAEPALKAGLLFIAFCLASSATYAINDAVDRDADRRHPTKRFRPLARGAVSLPAVFALAGVLMLAAIVTAMIWVNRPATLVLLCYLLMSIAYSAWLKERVILDVIIIALGFVFRAVGGAVAVSVPTSSWLIACVFTLCLFMGFGKRRCELAMLSNEDDARLHRGTLVRYTPHLLTHLITVSAGIAVITFLLYTLDTAGHPAPFQKQHLFYTLPLVVYGIFRFAMLTEAGNHSGPTEIVLKDKPMLLTILLWALCALIVAYQVRLFGAHGLEGLLRSVV
jgi:4-hydroxybenzoate polyprenyltransferase